jgi:hypothetical protein
MHGGKSTLGRGQVSNFSELDSQKQKSNLRKKGINFRQKTLYKPPNLALYMWSIILWSCGNDGDASTL